MKRLFLSLVLLFTIHEGISQIERLIPGYNLYGFNDLDIGGSEGTGSIFFYMLANQAPQNNNQVIDNILINYNGSQHYVDYDYDQQNQRYRGVLYSFPAFHNLKDSVLINFDGNGQKTRSYSRISMDSLPFIDGFQVDYTYTSAGLMDEVIDIKDLSSGPPYLYERKKKFYYSNGIPDSAEVFQDFLLSTIHFHFSGQGQLDSIINKAKPSGSISKYLTYQSAQQIVRDSVFYDFGFQSGGNIVQYFYDNQSRLDSACNMELDSSGNIGAFIIAMKVNYNSDGNYSSFEIRENKGSAGIIPAIYLFNYKSSISVQETADINLNVYPNPTNGILNIDCDRKNMEVRILDLQGSVVYKSSNENKIDLSGLSQGIYFFELVSEGDLHREMIVLTKE